MPFSLEQDMIQALNNCINTSNLKTKKHHDLNASGYFTREIFKGETWALWGRTEATSEIKRKYLRQLIAELERSHNFHVERGQILEQSFSLIPSSTSSSSSSEPVMTKSPIAIKSEINLQMSQFRAIQAFLVKARLDIESTIGFFTSAGGESLKALEECEAMLKAGITRWIMQMQQNNYHTKGIFPQNFQATPTCSEGTLFEAYVHELMKNRMDIPTGEALDPDKKQAVPALLLDPRASGVFETASLVGRASAASAASIKRAMKDAGTQVESSSSDSSSSNIVLLSRQSFMPIAGAPPAYTDPNYAHVNAAAAAAENGDWDARKDNSHGRRSPTN